MVSTTQFTDDEKKTLLFKAAVCSYQKSYISCQLPDNIIVSAQSCPVYFYIYSMLLCRPSHYG